jgi:hypothetical protein
VMGIRLLGVGRCSPLGLVVRPLFLFLPLSLVTDCFMDIEGPWIALLTEVPVGSVLDIVDSHAGTMLPH